MGGHFETPVVHVLSGLVGAGKSTLARALATESNAVRLNRDEWMIRLHGLPHTDPEYARLLGPCTELLWDTALSVVEVGRSVVLDWNHWSRSQRADADRRTRAVGARLVVHRLDVPLETAIVRAEARTAGGDPLAHTIDAEGLRHFVTIYEPPTSDEGIELVVHADSPPPGGDL